MRPVRETLCDVYIISQEPHYGQPSIQYPCNAGEPWEAVCLGVEGEGGGAGLEEDNNHTQ